MDNAELVHVTHHAAGGGRLSTFFAVDAWAGTPRIAEPRQVLAVGLVFARRAPRTAGSFLAQALTAVRAGCILTTSRF